MTLLCCGLGRQQIIGQSRADQAMTSGVVYHSHTAYGFANGHTRASGRVRPQKLSKSMDSFRKLPRRYLMHSEYVSRVGFVLVMTEGAEKCTGQIQVVH